MSTSRRFPGCPLISSRNNTRESLDLGSWMTFLKIQKNIPTRWCDDTCYTCAFNGTKPIVYWMSNSATWSFQKSHFTCLVGNLWRFHGFGIFFLSPNSAVTVESLQGSEVVLGRAQPALEGEASTFLWKGGQGWNTLDSSGKKNNGSTEKQGRKTQRTYDKNQRCHLNLVHKQEIKPECAFNTSRLCSCSNTLQLLSFTTPRVPHL